MSDGAPPPDGLPPEVAKLQAVLAGDPGPEPELPEPVPAVSLPEIPSTIPPARRVRRKRPKLYDPERGGHMRATKEEGLGVEMTAVRAEARGTPFYEERPTAKKPLTGAAAQSVASKQQAEMQKIIERLKAQGLRKTEPVAEEEPERRHVPPWRSK